MAEISRLPGPVMDLWEWQFEGACRDADQDLFFHPEGERGSARRRRAEAAKAICATCPVLKECREQSLAGARALRRVGRAVRGRARRDPRPARPRQPRRLTAPPTRAPRLGGTIEARGSACPAPTHEGPPRQLPCGAFARERGAWRPSAHLTTTARMSRAERMRYSSPAYLTSVPPYLL